MYGAIPKEPVPVSDCLEWELLPDAEDLVETPGQAAFVKITFALTFTPPSDGTEFKIWGRDFIFSGDFDYLAMSFDSDGEANPARNNFANMIEANIYFDPYVTVIRSGDDNEIVEIRWNTCAVLESFDGINTDLSAFTAIGATVEVENGISPVYVPGYKLTLSLMKYIGTQFSGTFRNLMLPLGVEPKKTCDGALPTYLEVMEHAKKTLFCPVPTLDDVYEEEPLNQNMMARIVLKYGWVYRSETCQTLTGTARKSDEVLVINSAFDVDDAYKMRPYWYGHPDGFPPGQFVVKFLTNQPDIHLVSEDTKAHLWLTCNWLDTYPTFAKMLLHIVVYKVGTPGIYEILDIEYNTCEYWQVKSFNVSPGRILAESTLADISELEAYEVKVDIVDASLDIIDNGTEYKKYVIDRTCLDATDILFTTPPGGISPILVEKLEGEIVQEGTEICTASACNSAEYGGRTLTDFRNYERVTYRARRFYSEQEVQFFKGLKTSPERWVRRPYGDGWIARKFIIETGGVKIFQSGEYVDLIATGYFSDIPYPNPK